MSSSSDELYLRIQEMVFDSADEHGVLEPNAEQLGSALLDVLGWAARTKHGFAAAEVLAEVEKGLNIGAIGKDQTR
jgi:hypothetical protein